MSDNAALAIMFGAVFLWVVVQMLAMKWLMAPPKKAVEPFEWPEVPPGECNCYGILPGMTPITKCAECGREIK